MNLKNGDVLICKADRVIPNLIKKATGSEWNHSAIYVECWDMAGVVEAQPDGINWKPFEAWEKQYNYEYLVYRNDISVPRYIARKAMSKAGHTGYDFVSFLIRQPFKLLTGRWRKRGQKKEEAKMICSEFVGWVYHMPQWWKMTPDDQFKHLEKSFNWKLVN